MKELDDEFIAMYQKFTSMQGMDQLIGSIVAILYLSPKPVAMEDIAKKTGYSLASISNKVKMLEQVEMVSRVNKPGTRKIYLYIDKDLSKMMKGLFVKKLAALKMANDSVPKIIDKYKDKAKKPEEKEKIELLKGYYKQISRFEYLIAGVLKEMD